MEDNMEDNPWIRRSIKELEMLKKELALCIRIMDVDQYKLFLEERKNLGFHHQCNFLLEEEEE